MLVHAFSKWKTLSAFYFAHFVRNYFSLAVAIKASNGIIPVTCSVSNTNVVDQVHHSFQLDFSSADETLLNYFHEIFYYILRTNFVHLNEVNSNWIY